MILFLFQNKHIMFKQLLYRTKEESSLPSPTSLSEWLIVSGLKILSSALVQLSLNNRSTLIKIYVLLKLLTKAEKHKYLAIFLLKLCLLLPLFRLFKRNTVPNFHVSQLFHES